MRTNIETLYWYDRLMFSFCAGLTSSLFPSTINNGGATENAVGILIKILLPPPEHRNTLPQCWRG